MIASVFCHFSDLWSLLSPPAHVPFYSPGSQDSIEWWTISVGGFRPNLWLFLEDMVKNWKSEICLNIVDLGQQEISRMFIFFVLSIYIKDEFFFWGQIVLQLIWKRQMSSSLSKNLLPRKFSGFFEMVIWANYFWFSYTYLVL